MTQNHKQIFEHLSSSVLTSRLDYFDIRDLENFFEQPFVIKEVNLIKLNSKKEVIEKFSKTLKFPDYFSKNWDSFEECLAELGWHHNGLLIIVVFGFQKNRSIKSELMNFVSIVDDISDEWKKIGCRSLQVLLVG